MPKGKVIVSPEHFQLIIDRLCYELIEQHDDFSQSCIIGIQPRGSFLSDRLVERLRELGISELLYGKLDITFFRDDFRTSAEPLSPHTNEINFLLENKRVLLIDDVLYTGRTVTASLSALQHYGRPHSVELVALIDRRFNRHLPIQADYVGHRVDALDEAYVQVQWNGQFGSDRVLLFPEKRS